MIKRRRRFPAYATVIGEGTEVKGGVEFAGALHVEGKVTGDIKGISPDGCALTLGQCGVIEGNLDVPHVVLDGTVIGDIRATYRAELASGARIEGTLYYNVLEMAQGAEVNGKLLHISEDQALLLAHRVAEAGQSSHAAERAKTLSGSADGDTVDPYEGVPQGDGNT